MADTWPAAVVCGGPAIGVGSPAKARSAGSPSGVARCRGARLPAPDGPAGPPARAKARWAAEHVQAAVGTAPQATERRASGGCRISGDAQPTPRLPGVPKSAGRTRMPCICCVFCRVPGLARNPQEAKLPGPYIIRSSSEFAVRSTFFWRRERSFPPVPVAGSPRLHRNMLIILCFLCCGRVWQELARALLMSLQRTDCHLRTHPRRGT